MSIIRQKVTIYNKDGLKDKVGARKAGTDSPSTIYSAEEVSDTTGFQNGHAEIQFDLGGIPTTPDVERDSELFANTTWTKYLYENGIAEWEETEEYKIGSLVKQGYILYVSKIDNNINNALTDTNSWDNLGDIRGLNKTNVITQEGDIIVGNNLNIPTRLPIGNTEYILKSNGVAPEWVAVPIATEGIVGRTQFATTQEYFDKNNTKAINAEDIANDMRNERYSVGNSINGLAQLVPTGDPAVGGNGYNLLTSFLETNEDQRSNISITYKNISNATQVTYLDEANNKFLFPSNLNTYNLNNIIFTIRVTTIIDIGSTNNATTKGYIRLLRVVDNSIISSKQFSQSDFGAETNVPITFEFKTFVEGETDPFVLDGTYIDILNNTNSVSTLTIQSTSIRIFRD